MMALVGAELRRIADRRLFRVTLLLAAIGLVGGGFLAFFTSASLSQATYQQRVSVVNAQRQVQQAAVEACLQRNGVPAPSGDVPPAVARKCFPDRPIRVHDPRFYTWRLKGVLQGIVGVLAIAGWALGASFVGAEFASRGMTTMLTWEPRRGRVFGAKLAATIAAIAAFAVTVLAVGMITMLPSLWAHGAPIQAGDPGWATMFGIIGRGTLLAALSAAMGFGIATIGRNTAAVLGAGFAYIVILENILGNTFARWRAWLLLGNVIVFVSGTPSPDIAGRSVAGAGVFLAGVAATLAIAAATTFSARDVA